MEGIFKDYFIQTPLIKKKKKKKIHLYKSKEKKDLHMLKV